MLFQPSFGHRTGGHQDNQGKIGWEYPPFYCPHYTPDDNPVWSLNLKIEPAWQVML